MIVTSVVLGTCGGLILLVTAGHLQDGLDRSLQHRAAHIERAFEREPEAALTSIVSEDRFFQVLAPDGAVLLATDNLPSDIPVVRLPPAAVGISTQRDLPIEDDEYRVLVRRFEVEGVEHWMVVGESVDHFIDAIQSLAAGLAVTIPVSVVMLAATVWWLVGRTLRPVEEIRRLAAGVGLAQLDRRVVVPGTGDEVDQLAITMNGMLARLEEAAERERRFVSDASHELRSPLTRMRTTLEVDLAHGAGSFEPACRSALDDAMEMQQLVDDLLFLARHDAGHEIAGSELVDFDVLVDEEFQHLSPATEIDVSAVTAATVRGSSAQLARMVRNLSSNAVRHARSVVKVGLRETDECVVLTIEDDGPGILPVDRERVFDRFVRLDEARTRWGDRSGLGLAIARGIAIAHGGSIRVEDGALHGARMVVEMPRGRPLRSRARSERK